MNPSDRWVFRISSLFVFVTFHVEYSRIGVPDPVMAPCIDFGVLKFLTRRLIYRRHSTRHRKLDGIDVQRIPGISIYQHAIENNIRATVCRLNGAATGMNRLQIYKITIDVFYLLSLQWQNDYKSIFIVNIYAVHAVVRI